MWKRPPSETFEQQKARVVQLAKRWGPFDWTEQLDMADAVA
jgi:hypothetical protein